MKSFIIVVLLVALGAAAFFTRPNSDDFKRFVVAHQTSGQDGFFKHLTAEASAEAFSAGCTFNDRYLWVDVKRDGKTVFTGAFAHWFSHEAVKQGLDKVEDKAREKVREGGRVISEKA